MTTLKAGIIGTGLRRKYPQRTGAGIAHVHASGYKASPDIELVAACDIVPFHLEKFREEHGVPRGYPSADEMLANEDLDIVSICLWPHLHAPMTIKVAESGVKAIHCEKPMATTWGDAKRMVEVCEANDVILTFNHMRRFGAPFRKAKELLDAGAIGQLERLEAYTGNLYDWGTHWFDMLFFYNDETPVEWVIAQIEARNGGTVFGAHLDGQGLAMFKYANGVSGLMATGANDFFKQGEPLRSVGCGQRLLGSEGIIEVGVDGGPEIRVRNADTGGVWKTIELEAGGLHGEHLHAAALQNLADAVLTGSEPELAARRALQTAELFFGAFESSRRRGRVEFPLDVDDNALVAMLDNADVCAWPDAYVEANGINLHYWRTGDGSKPPLVLCHGYSDNGLCWMPTARVLERDFDVIMVDARGHGLSDAPETGYGTPYHAADVAGLVQALGLEKPAIMGHSMGASTASYAAATYPELFGKVVLEDPGWWGPDSRRLSMTDEERDAWRDQRRDDLIRQKQMSRQALIDKCREDNPTWPSAVFGPWALSKQQLRPNVVERLRERGKPWNEVAEALQSQTLLITAETEKGAIVTKEMAAKAQELNDLIQVVHVTGVGHCIRREDFDGFMAAVKAFLA